MATSQGRVHPLDNPPSFAFPTPPSEHEKSDVGSDEFDRGDTSPFLSRRGPNNETYIIQIPKEQILRQPPPDHAHRAKVYARRPIRRKMVRRCCCSVIAAVLCLVVVAAAAVGVLYLIVRPKAPSYSLTSVNMTGVDPVLKSAAAALSPVIDATILADNKNKRLSVLYQGGGTVEVLFEDTKLSTGDWPEFRQAPGNVTEVQLQMTGSGILLTATIRDALISGHNNKSVPFTMRAKVPVKVKYGFLTTWTITARVTCDVTVDGISGTATVLKKDCRAKSHYLW